MPKQRAFQLWFTTAGPVCEIRTDPQQEDCGRVCRTGYVISRTISGPRLYASSSELSRLLMRLSPLAELKVDEWNRRIDVNIRGVLHSIAAVLPHMTSLKAGHVIN